MSGQVQNWGPQTNAADYFGGQKKAGEVADRRPVIRRPSDLVGPGIAVGAVRITDFSDLLATYNGFFSYQQTGLHDDVTLWSAPIVDADFVMFVSSDPILGGVQLATRLSTNVQYRRTFSRNPGDASFLTWSSWVNASTT